MINITGLFKVMSKEIKTYGNEGKKFNEFVLQEYGKEGTIKAVIFGSYLDMDKGNTVFLSGDLQIRNWEFKGKIQTGYSVVVTKVDILGKPAEKKVEKPTEKPKSIPKPEVLEDDIPF